MKHPRFMDTHIHARGGRSKACRGRKKFTVDMAGGRRIETRRKKHREKGNTHDRERKRARDKKDRYE